MDALLRSLVQNVQVVQYVETVVNWCPVPEVRHIIPASFRPKISPSPLFQRGLEPYGQNSLFGKREAVKKFMRPSNSFVKSPLAPLFQRGEPKSGVFSNGGLEIFSLYFPFL